MKIRQLLDDYVELCLTDWKGALCKYCSENIVRKIKFQEAEDYFEILEGERLVSNTMPTFWRG